MEKQLITLSNNQLSRIVKKFDFKERLNFSPNANYFQSERIEAALTLPGGSCIDLYYHAVFSTDDDLCLRILFLDVEGWSSDGSIANAEFNRQCLTSISDDLRGEINEYIKE